MPFSMLFNVASFVELSEKLRQFECNRKESPVLSTFDYPRSLMHSIYRNEKCDLDETKRGNIEHISEKTRQESETYTENR